jgi:hypothetical protein
MNKSSVSQSVALSPDRLTSTKDRGFRDRVRWTDLVTVRQVLLPFVDSTTEYAFCGPVLRIPLSHELPLSRRAFPLYSSLWATWTGRSKCVSA